MITANSILIKGLLAVERMLSTGNETRLRLVKKLFLLCYTTILTQPI